MFLVRVSEQFVSTAIADIQGAVFSTSDEASWILTVYTMASFAGIVAAVPLIRALGLGRYLVASSIVFASTALCCASAPDLHVMIALRAVQGLSSGGFGPAAFVAVFMIAGGPRLAFMVTVLALLLLSPSTVGPVLGGFVEHAFGWQALFLSQAGVGALIAMAAGAWAPRQAPVWSALKTDWAAVMMLSLALALLTLVLNQGTRRFWFESNMIFWCTTACIGAFAGVVFLARFSPQPIMQPSLLVTRRFGISNGLNLIFRATLVVTSYLTPQFLAIVQGYRPLEIARVMLWAAVPQLIAWPLVWRLMHGVDARWLMGLGICLCAAGAALAADGTSLVSAEQLRIELVLFAVGQILFLAPALVVGATSLKPAELPTASLAFNMTTLGGTALGSGVISHLVTEREKFHSNIITEHVSLFDSMDRAHIAKLAERLSDRFVDDARASAGAISLVGSDARREAWVLAFNDAFLLVAALLTITAFGVIAIGRSTPLRRRPSASSGELS